MSVLYRKDFSRGWFPSADAANCPDNALLRMDNLELDEQGALSLRRGSALAFHTANETPLGIYSADLGGTKHRFTVSYAGEHFFRTNGQWLDYGDKSSPKRFSFCSWLGQVFMASQGSHPSVKTDGIHNTSRWGIAAPQPAPRLSPIPADSKTLATCDSTESPGFVADEGVRSMGGQFIRLDPDFKTGRAVVTKTFATESDFSVYDGGQRHTDNDLIEMYVWVVEPTKLKAITFMIDVNGEGARFERDYYTYTFSTDELRRDATGWTRVSIPCSSMQRVGSTYGKGWNTVKAVRLVVEGFDEGTPVYFDNIRIIGGHERPLSGKYRYCYCLARPMGSYVALSAASPLSEEVEVRAQALTVTIPTDYERDFQATEAWIFRTGGTLDKWYRVGVRPIFGVGAYSWNDTVSDIEALATNIKLDLSDGGPPHGNVIGIEGPHYDRLFVLTKTDLYPSRRLNPEVFSTEQVIKIAGSDETCYWIKKAFNSLYIGTNKDIYRLEGDGSEYPDGTVNWTKISLNVGSPPVGYAVATEGNFLVYLAADGWRAFDGVSSTPLKGDTDLLFRGQARYGVDPVNLTAAALDFSAFSACIAKGFLYCLTPEGSHTTSSVFVWKYDLARNVWYRMIYPYGLCMLYAEPDGTVLAVGSKNQVYVLETGDTDAGDRIWALLLTKLDDNGQPNQLKHISDLLVHMDTGGDNALIDVFVDQSGTPAVRLLASSDGMGVYRKAVPVGQDIRSAHFFFQMQISGNFSKFRLRDYTVYYTAGPPVLEFWENPPEKPSPTVRRFDSINLVINTLGGNVEVNPVLDGVSQPLHYIVATDKPLLVRKVFPAPLEGHDLWVQIKRLTSGFELYDCQVGVLDEYPPKVLFWENKPKAPSHRRKRFGGVTLVINTGGKKVTVTPVLDGTDLPPEEVVTDSPVPVFLVLENIVGKDLWVKCSADTPFYQPYLVEPRVVEEFPLIVRGLLPRTNLGHDGVKVISGIKIKACTLGVPCIFTPVLDGVNHPTTLALTSDPNEPVTDVLNFDEPQSFTDIALRADQEVELYEWEPIVLYTLPGPRRVWDTGFMDLGLERIAWVREIRIKCKTPANLTVTPYFDDVAFPPYTVVVGDKANKLTVFRVPVGRGYKGRQPRVVVSCESEFFPVWLEFHFRPSGHLSQQKPYRVVVQ